MYYIIVLRSQVVAVVYRWVIFSLSFAVFCASFVVGWSTTPLTPIKCRESTIFALYRCELSVALRYYGGREGGDPSPRPQTQGSLFSKFFFIFLYLILSYIFTKLYFMFLYSLAHFF